MSEKIAQPAKLHILFVDCTQNGQYEDAPIGISDIDFLLTSQPFNAQEMMEFKECDCVLIRVDPGSRGNLEQLAAVLCSAVAEGVPLVSMSTFDASWIENLMAQLGVEKHFRQFPNYNEISNVIFQYTKPLYEKLEGVAQ